MSDKPAKTGELRVNIEPLPPSLALKSGQEWLEVDLQGRPRRPPVRGTSTGAQTLRLLVRGFELDPQPGLGEGGRFRARVRLRPGDNRIEAIASATDGRTATDSVQLVVHAPDDT